MSISQLMNRPCTVLQRSTGGTDDYGNAETIDTAIATVCALQQQTRLASSEPATAGETSVTDWVIFLPADTDIDTGDAVAVDGHIYELVGDPWKVRNDRTAEFSHLEAKARRAAGTGAGS